MELLSHTRKKKKWQQFLFSIVRPDDVTGLKRICQNLGHYDTVGIFRKEMLGRKNTRKISQISM